MTFPDVVWARRPGSPCRAIWTRINSPGGVPVRRAVPGGGPHRRCGRKGPRGRPGWPSGRGTRFFRVELPDLPVNFLESGEVLVDDSMGPVERHPGGPGEGPDGLQEKLNPPVPDLF